MRPWHFRQNATAGDLESMTLIIVSDLKGEGLDAPENDDQGPIL